MELNGNLMRRRITMPTIIKILLIDEDYIYEIGQMMIIATADLN